MSHLKAEEVKNLKKSIEENIDRSVLSYITHEYLENLEGRITSALTRGENNIQFTVDNYHVSPLIKALRELGYYTQKERLGGSYHSVRVFWELPKTWWERLLFFSCFPVYTFICT